MKNIVTHTQGQAGFAALIEQAQTDGVVPVSKNGKIRAFVLSRDKMSALLETMELQKDTELMKLVGQDRAGKIKFTKVPDAL